MTRNMDVEPLYTRAQLGRLAAVPDDALAFWIREDLVRSIALGPRRHRRFSQLEVRLAAFLGVARKHGLNIAMMRVMVSQIRESVAYYESIGPFDMDYITGFDHLTPDYVALMLKQGRWSEEKAVQATRLIEFGGPTIPVERHDDMWLAMGFLEGSGILAIWMNEDGSWELDTRINDESGGIQAACVIAFDFRYITRIDWSKAGAS